VGFVRLPALQLHVSFERRTAAELFGQMFSLLMENREREAESGYENRARELHDLGRKRTFASPMGCASACSK
jgi:light-regulated signal transduction histidine kinase (bacteriophytochrome)